MYHKSTIVKAKTHFNLWFWMLLISQKSIYILLTHFFSISIFINFFTHRARADDGTQNMHSHYCMWGGANSSHIAVIFFWFLQSSSSSRCSWLSCTTFRQLLVANLSGYMLIFWVLSQIELVKGEEVSACIKMTNVSFDVQFDCETRWWTSAYDSGWKKSAQKRIFKLNIVSTHSTTRQALLWLFQTQHREEHEQKK